MKLWSKRGEFHLVSCGHRCKSDAEAGSMLHNFIRASIPESVRQVSDRRGVTTAAFIRVNQTKGIQRSRFRVRRS